MMNHLSLKGTFHFAGSINKRICSLKIDQAHPFFNSSIYTYEYKIFKLTGFPNTMKHVGFDKRNFLSVCMNEIENIKVKISNTNLFAKNQKQVA